jgi:hypothetical protein
MRLWNGRAEGCIESVQENRQIVMVLDLRIVLTVLLLLVVGGAPTWRA